MDSERLRRIRNYQNTEFYPALVLRPLAVLGVIVVGDWRFVTPNLLTLLATLFKAAAAGLVLTGERGWVLAGVAALQLGAVLDHMDGTLARYRRATSNLGFFYDTISDMVTWFLVLMAIGWIAWERSGDPRVLVLAAAGVYGLGTSGYMRSVVETAAAKHAKPVDGHEGGPPPERTARDWGVWLLRCLGQAWRFQEMDLFFWVGLFLALDRPITCLWVIGATQMASMLVFFVVRARQMRAFDVP